MGSSPHAYKYFFFIFESYFYVSSFYISVISLSSYKICSLSSCFPPFALQRFCSNLIKSPEPVQATPKSNRKVGRPRKLFEDKKKDAQYKEADEICNNHSLPALLRAVCLAARREKMIHAAAIFEELREDTDYRALKLREAKKFFEKYPSKIHKSSSSCTHQH